MNYWQVGAGYGARDCSQIFLDYGVMLIGPGYTGKYDKNKDFFRKNKNVPIYKLNTIKAFAEKVKKDDIVVLKRPSGKKWKVLAVGTVKKSEYQFLEVFDDVEGWNLQHCRKVKWFAKKDGKKNKIIEGLAIGTFRRINKSGVKEKLDSIKDKYKLHKSKKIPKQYPFLILLFGLIILLR